MIKLTINPDTQAETRTFEQTTLIIGSASSEHVDLPLHEESLQEEHVKICEEDGGYVVINSTNDPFVTLNGNPFGRSTLTEGDRLTIANTNIHFDAMSVSKDAVNTPPPEDFDLDVELQKLHDLFDEENVSVDQDTELADLDIDALFAEVEKLDDEEQEQEQEETAETTDEDTPEETDEKETTEEPIPDVTLEFSEEKDEELSFLEKPEAPPTPETTTEEKIEETPPDSTEQTVEVEEEEDTYEKEEWLPDEQEALEDETDLALFDHEDLSTDGFDTEQKQSFLGSFVGLGLQSTRFLTVAIIVLALTGLLSLGTYLKISSTNVDEEIQATKITADIAMAMAHAYIYGPVAYEENWKNSQFLEKHLRGVLPSNYHTTPSIGTDRTFHHIDYRLHIIHQEDRFFVVVKPTRKLSQWLIPKYAFLIDSETMVLKKTRDIKTLNTLISSAHAENIQAVQAIWRSVGLARLHQTNTMEGFNPPEELATTAPGAQNLIYNAPRYYKLGQQIAHRIFDTLDGDAIFSEVRSLKTLIDKFSILPNFVLYTSQGREAAIKLRQTLNSGRIKTPFLFGYLTFTDTGTIASCHLLEDTALAEEITPVVEEFYTDEPKAKVDTPVFEKKAPEPIAEPPQPTSPPPSPADKQVVSLFKKIPRSATLVELETVAIQIADLLTPEDIPDVDQLLTLENKFRGHVLQKVGEIILSPQQQHRQALFIPSHRKILDNILITAKVSDHEEKEFYLQEFDLLVEKYRKISETPPTPVQETKTTLSTQISSVPLEGETIAINDAEQKKNLGRIGQQIILRESVRPPSKERARHLREAINLLSQATGENRAYWEDILEARRLLAENPKAKILEIVHSPIGFTAEQRPLSKNIKDSIKQYIHALQAVATTQATPQYYIQYEHLKRTQKNNLNNVVTHAKTIQNQSTNLNDYWKQYILDLQEFYTDYQKAKDQGLFVNDRHHHATMIAKLEEQLEACKNLQNDIEKLTEKLFTASHTYENLAEIELMRIETEEPIAPKDALTLERQTHNIIYPTVSLNNLGKKITTILQTDVSPISGS